MDKIELKSEFGETIRLEKIKNKGLVLSIVGSRTGKVWNEHYLTTAQVKELLNFLKTEV